MRVLIEKGRASGAVCAPPSKSYAHRYLIAAALSKDGGTVHGISESEDMKATLSCLASLGARFEKEGDTVRFLDRSGERSEIFSCLESGSSLRFMIPIALTATEKATFIGTERLLTRGVSVYEELFASKGITVQKTAESLTFSGRLQAGDYRVKGDVSSQFITGLLFALSISKRASTLTISTKMESEPYVNITLDALSAFGVNVIKSNNAFIIPDDSTFTSPENLEVEGDWSNAAFPLALGIIGGAPISVEGLLPTSSQGDKEIVTVLRRFGGRIEEKDNCFTAYPSPLSGIEIDASNIPDLVPILATVASVARGETVIYGASRLRLKESDRLLSVSTVLSSLGADISQTDDGLIINGKEHLIGGSVDSFGDHRIAMSAAGASAVCTADLIISGAESVNKSYPDFWRDMRSLGLIFTEN